MRPKRHAARASETAAMTDAPRRLRSPIGILDNRSRGIAGDFLKAHLKENTDLSVVSAYFTVSAYEALGEELERVRGLSRFLLNFGWRLVCVDEC